MAKKATKSGGKSLVIVESPAKARTISKFLGGDYDVQASIGHVRDLPKGTREIPEQYKGEEWAYLGVNVNEGFVPIYVVPADKKAQVAKLRNAIKTARDLYLATDEDREGEAISWHLFELLKPKIPVHRLVFHEITKEAIDEALANPRDIDDGLVRAQETRRILDRLYGYEVSPLLWRKIGPRLSAGRVQSVAVRLIVEREQERREFTEASYWDLVGTFEASGGSFQADLVSVDGRTDPRRAGFRPADRAAEGRPLAVARRAAGPAIGRAAAAGDVPHHGVGGQALHACGRRRRSPRARCSRKPIASSVSPLGARCRWPRACTKTATSRTCVPTRPISPRSPWMLPGNSWNRSMAASLSAGQAARLHLESEERPGGPRGHSTGRTSVPAARIAASRVGE